MSNKQLRRMGIKYQNKNSRKKIPLVEAIRAAQYQKDKEEQDKKNGRL